MINFIKGAKIENYNDLSEGYKIDNDHITAVVNAEKIMIIINNFIEANKNNRLFLFIEVPFNEEDEDIIKKATETEVGIFHSTHKDVYYLDDISSTLLDQILPLFSDILVNDGLTNFGVGVMGDNKNEIGKYRYNVVAGFYNEMDELQDIFELANIKENEHLILPDDIISPKHPRNK